jgi:hypothetical protein
MSCPSGRTVCRFWSALSACLGYSSNHDAKSPIHVGYAAPKDSPQCLELTTPSSGCRRLSLSPSLTYDCDPSSAHAGPGVRCFRRVALFVGWMLCAKIHSCASPLLRFSRMRSRELYKNLAAWVLKRGSISFELHLLPDPSSMPMMMPPDMRDLDSRHRSSDGSEDDIPDNPKLDNSSDAWFARHVLHIEGEAYAGLSALYILAELMYRVGRMEQDSSVFRTQAFSSDSSPLFEPLESGQKSVASSKTVSPYRPCHYFDFISGTSLGGSGAIMLGVMRYTIDETIQQTELLLTGVVPRIPRDIMSVMIGRRAKNSSMLDRHLRSNFEESHKAEYIASDARLFTMSADNYKCQT